MSIVELSDIETYDADIFLKDIQNIEVSFKKLKMIIYFKLFLLTIFYLFRHFQQIMIWILMIIHTRQKWPILQKS
jgi:hypothetical protein